MSDQFESKIQNINVVVKRGNIAAEDVDCIVVPEFDDCSSRGGVGYAIEDAGMSAGLDAYDEIAKGKTLKYGDAVITESGKAGTKITIRKVIFETVDGGMLPLPSTPKWTLFVKPGIPKDDLQKLTEIPETLGKAKAQNITIGKKKKTNGDSTEDPFEFLGSVDDF